MNAREIKVEACKAIARKTIDRLGEGMDLNEVFYRAICEAYTAGATAMAVDLVTAIPEDQESTTQSSRKSER